MGSHGRVPFHCNNRHSLASHEDTIFNSRLTEIRLSYFIMALHVTALFSSRLLRKAAWGAGIVGLTLLLSAPAHALSVVPRSFDELAQLAELVIVGTVKDVRSEFANGGLDQENIVSYVSFNGLEVIKGESSAAEYTLQVPGGVVGRFAQDYPGVPLFHAGQRYVVFIRGNRRDFFPVVGVNQGLFRVLTDAQGRQVVVQDDIVTHAGQRALSSVVQNAPTLDSFERKIRAALTPVPADAGGKQP